MPKYRVKIHRDHLEMLSRGIVVEADSAEDAIRSVKKVILFVAYRE